MSLGGAIAHAAGGRLIMAILAAFVLGGLVFLGAYFGVSWLIEHVSITVK